MGRAPCCDKANVKKGPWSPEEDAKLKSFIEQNGTGGNWIALPHKIGLKRCGKSCRLRWLNYLRPNIKHGGFSEEEDNIICSLYINIGSRWSIIAAQLPGRTDNDIKNYWNTKLKKKLLGKQPKQQQHQPRRASFRQEIKQETTYSFTATATAANMNQHIAAAHWSELSCSASAIMPVMTSSACPIQAQVSNFISSDHEDSLKNLLMKLGGRFSDNQTCTMYPQDQTYANTVVNPMISSSSINSAETYMFEGSGYGDLPIEMVYGIQQQQELQGMGSFYGGNNNNNNGASSGESSSWGNVSSLDYPQLVSDFENCLLNLPQDHSSFEVSSYFGPH